MTLKARNIRADEELIATADLVAKTQGLSFNQLAVNSLTAEIARAREDSDFMDRLRKLADRDRAILDRLSDQ